MWRSVLRRAAVVLAIDTFALRLLDWLLEGFDLGSLGSGVATAVAIGILNALLWPLLARLALPLAVITLGGVALVLNAGLVALAVALIPGAELSGFAPAVMVVVGLAALSPTTCAPGRLRASAQS